ncbi:hypothetical protein BZZ01_20610 [Nostocales cyanobacterium HT-58-2]|nr:hypothetical protein BZZ01_20610 [Nostocales cyanobacterium HT-58-2]
MSDDKPLPVYGESSMGKQSPVDEPQATGVGLRGNPPKFARRETLLATSLRKRLTQLFTKFKKSF